MVSTVHPNLPSQHAVPPSTVHAEQCFWKTKSWMNSSTHTYWWGAYVLASDPSTTHKSSSWTLLWEQDDCKPLHSSRDKSLGEKECVTADKHFFLCFKANHTVDMHTHTQNLALMGIIPVCYETTCTHFTNIWSHTRIRGATHFFYE